MQDTGKMEAPLEEIERLRSRVAELEKVDAERRRSEKAQELKTDQLTAVTDAMTAFLETGDWCRASGVILRSSLAQTESEYGFVGVVVEGPVLRVLAHEGIEWDSVLGRSLYEDALRTYQKLGYLEFTNIENLFGRVITDRRTVTANDPATDSRAAGIPEGHPLLRHFLGVPIFKGAEVVGLIGIANRPGGYSGAEQKSIEILCGATSVLCDGYRRHLREEALDLERSRVEQALRESDARLKLAMDTLDGGIWDWNVQTGQILFSPSWARMLGHKLGELEPHVSTWEERLHPEERESVLQVVKDHLEGRTPTYQSEHRLRAKSGDWIWVVDSGQVISRDEQGAPLRMTGVDINITARRQAEEASRELQAQMQYAQKLESLGVLAGGVAHDFNNLLTAILGFASLALAKSKTAEAMRECVQQIENAGIQAAELTNQLLAYSGRGKFVTRPLDLSRLVKEMGRLLEAVISKKVALEYDLGDGLSSIDGDTSQIRQIVMNLITNASEAVGEGEGIIRAITGLMKADRRYLSNTYLDEGLPEGEYVYVEVSDTGCGMDRETLKKVFDPFFTTKFTGRGLGLASVLGIVRGHHGAIMIDSEPGRGTTFRVLFPRVSDEVKPKVKIQHSSTRQKGGTVLVVDDEDGVRSVSRMMLEQSGFNVLNARDGEEGLKVFREHQGEICAVLLDLAMPKMDGEEVFRRIREIKTETPVILSSGYNEQELEDRFADRGFAGFLQKPYRMQELTAKLNRVLLESC